GYSVTHNLLSVLVFSPHGIPSDADATAFMVMGF
ncbi:MAG: FAD:protein FMN transferase, partial [Bacteroidales bacterium]|nr:FAD:protein FMN transferase [Bacteroidales bacterium]